MVLLLNAVAILSEDRFLARGTSHPESPALSFKFDTSTVGWSRNPRDAGFGQQDSSVKVRIGELIAGVRLVSRGTFGSQTSWHELTNVVYSTSDRR
jgi:hypothetical protein